MNEDVPRWYGYPPQPWPPGSTPASNVAQWGPVLLGDSLAQSGTSRSDGADTDRGYLAILLNRQYRWWRPAVGMLLFTAVALAATIVLVIVPLVFLGARGDITGPESLASPWVLLATNLSLAALIPCALFAAWAVHRVRPGLVSSVAGRIRWRWLAAYSGVALVVVVGTYMASVIVMGVAGASTDPADDASTADFVGWSVYLPLAAVILLTTPLQAAGEEYAFRGYLSQAIGAWAKTWRWVPILVTSLLFAVAHGQQDPALFTDRFIFGLALAVLTVRTGGLEAGIALHAANNLVILLIGALFTDLADTLTATQAPWALVGFDAVQLVVYGALVLALSKGRMQRTTGAGRRQPTPAAQASVPGPGTTPIAP